MKTIKINDNRSMTYSSIFVGYLDENNAEKIAFEIPEKYKDFSKKACLEADGERWARLLDNDTLIITDDITSHKDIYATIEFIDTENNIIARTSKLHMIIDDAIICEDIKPDEPKIIILNELIEKVTNLDNLITENESIRNSNEKDRISNENERISNENEREKYFGEIQKKVDDGEFNGATFLPNIDKNGDISWTNDKGLENPQIRNIRGPQGIQGERGIQGEQGEKGEKGETGDTGHDVFIGNIEDVTPEGKFIIEPVKNVVNGSEISLYNATDNVVQKLILDGKCEQETTTGKNLFDYISTLKTNYEGLLSTLNEDGSITTKGIPIDNYVVIIPSINITDMLEDGQIYTINQELPSDKLYVQINGKKQNNTWTYYNSKTGKLSFTVDKSSYVSYSIALQSGTTSNWGDEELTITNKYMLYKGDGSDTTFEKYTGGQASPRPDYPQEIETITGNVEVKSNGKNLFDKSKTTNGYYYDNNGNIVYEAESYVSDYIEVKKDNYTLSIDNLNNALRISTYDKDKNFIRRIVSVEQNSLTIEIAENENYVILSSNNLNNKDSMQFEIGTETTEYEPHKGSKIDINLGDNFVGKISETYKDELKINYNKSDNKQHINLSKKIGKVILNGSEDITRENTSTQNEYRFNVKINNALGVSTNEICTMSNKLLGVSRNDTWVNKQGIAQGKNFIQIFAEATKGYSIDEFKEWLSNNNIEVYYTLAETQEKDLGTITDLLRTFKPITIISNDIDSEMKIEYDTIETKLYYKTDYTMQEILLDDGLVNEDTFNEAIDIFNNNLDMKFDKPYYFEYSNNNGDYETTDEDTLAFFNEIKRLLEDGQRPCIMVRKGITKENAYQTYHFVVPQLGSSEDAYVILKSGPVKVRNDEFNIVDIKCEIDPQTRQITKVYEKAKDGKIKLNLPFTLRETMTEAEKVDIMQAVYTNWISGIWTNLTYVDANNQNYCLYDVEKFDDNIDFYIRKGGKASSVNGVGYYSYDRYKIRCNYQDNVILGVDIEELGDSYYLADNGQILGKNNATKFIPEQPYQPATKDYADSKILIVNLTKDEVAGLNADKTLEEIFKAIDNRNVVIAKLENDIVSLTYANKTENAVYFSNIFDDNSINISCVEEVWTNTEVQIITDKGGKMAGNLDMDGYSLKNISELHLDGSAPLYLGATVKPSGTLGSRITGTTSGEVAVVKADKQADYVPILIGEPTNPNHSATKEYVDSRITQSQLSQYPLYYAEVNGTVDNWCNSATLLPILKEAYSGGYKDIMVKTIDNARFMTCHGVDLQMLTQTSNANLKFVNLQYLTGSTVNKTRMYYGYAYAEGVQLNSHGEVVITGNCGILPSGTNYVDLMEKDGLKQISGYDSTKTQVLKNVQGQIKWVDEN